MEGIWIESVVNLPQITENYPSTNKAITNYLQLLLDTPQYTVYNTYNKRKFRRDGPTYQISSFNYLVRIPPTGCVKKSKKGYLFCDSSTKKQFNLYSVYNIHQCV